MRAPAKAPDRALFWHYPHYSNQLGKPGSAIRLGDFKLIRFHEDDHLKLYNLMEDIGEAKNLAAAQPAKTKELEKRLNAWLKSVDAKFPTATPRYDPARESEGCWWKQPGAFDRWGK